MSESNSLEFLLFSGAYDQVLARTAGARSRADSVAFIGALSLSGRLDEAESAFHHFVERSGETPEVVEARFFVVAGLCHSGRLGKALRHARDNLRYVRGAESRSRFWACQGLAALRYFEGRFPLARRFARRALAAAVEATFAYAQLLALDLSAHVALQTGSVFAGMRLLGQAEALARALGYTDNASTLNTAARVFQLRFLLSDLAAAIAGVEERLGAPEVSYFTKRNGLIELAGTWALKGERDEARRALDQARQIALPGSDSRGRTRWLVCHALCTALAEGPAAARESLEQARTCAGDQLTLKAEAGFVELVFVGERSAAALAAYRRVAECTGIQRARIAYELAAGEPQSYPARVEDGLCRVLLECRDKPALQRVDIVIDAGLFGLTAWALGREPGRRIVIGERRLISEDRGKVSVHELPNRPSLRVLAELGGGYCSREALMQSVWGVARFSPARHTPVLHTAVSRLRLALGEPNWIITHDDGYSLAEGVEIVQGTALPLAPSASSLPPPDDRERTLAFIDSEQSASSAEVARALGLSASTALRLLRGLADEGLLIRTGGGRSTRYARGPR